MDSNNQEPETNPVQTTTEPAANPAPATTEPAANPSQTTAEPAANSAQTTTEPTANPSGDKEPAANPDGENKPYNNLINSILGADKKDETGEKAEPEPMPENDEAWMESFSKINESEESKTFFSPIAGQLREKNISPSVAAAVAEICGARINEMAKQEKEARDAAAVELDAAARKAFGENDWKDISTGIEKYVDPKGMFYKVLTQTELGSDMSVLKILKTLGQSSREDKPRSDRTGGTGDKADLNHALFLRSFGQN